MSLNEPVRQKIEMQNSWQQVKHAKLYFVLLQASANRILFLHLRYRTMDKKVGERERNRDRQTETNTQRKTQRQRYGQRKTEKRGREAREKRD